jgi:PAS domain S-box-containing protein
MAARKLKVPKIKEAEKSGQTSGKQTGSKAKIAKKRNTLKAYNESQKRLSLALDSSNMGIWEWDMTTSEVWWSDNMYSLFGATSRSFDGTYEGFLKFVHNEDEKLVVKEIHRSLTSDKKYFVQFRIAKPDKTIRWIESTGKVFRNRKGQPVKMVGTVQDITDLKLSNFERKDWEARYKMVASASGQVIYDYDIASGNIAWSGTVYEVLGYSHLEMGSIHTWKKLIHPEDRENAVRQLEKAKQGLKPYDVTYRLRTKSKTYVHLHDKGFFLSNEKGQTYRMLGTMQDITDKVEVQKKLAESNRFRESMENAMPGMLYVYDLQKHLYLYVNHNATNMLGYTWEEIESLGNNFVLQLLHPDDLAKIPTWTNEPTRTVKDTEFRIKTKSGDWCWLSSRDTVFQRDKKGNVTQIIGLAQDITQRKQAEELLLKSEQSYRELFNMVGQEIYILNQDGTFLDVNHGACDVYEYSKEEFIGKTPTFLSVEGKNDIDGMGKMFNDAFQGIPQTFEWWGKKKSGGTFLKEVRISKGNYFGKDILIGLAWDVTQRRLTENSIRESEKHFRSLIQHLNVGVSLHNDKTEIILSNTTAHNLLGIEDNALIGKTPFDPAWDIIKENGAPFSEHEHPVSRVIATSKAVRGVVMGLFNPTKKERMWFLINAEPFFNDQAGALQVICTFTDITERKKIEEDLKESEQRFRTLQEASFGGIGLHDKGVIIDCNKGLSEITGYSRDELLGKDGLQLIAPEYRPLVMENILSGYHKPYDIEGIHKDGTRYFLEVHGKNIPYEGRIIRVTEFRNITARKLIEEKILEQNAKLEAITIDLKRKNDQLEEFTQIVSHNLRSPIGNILTLLTFMETADSEDEKAQYMKFLKESSTKALTTLEELNEVLKLKQNDSIEKQELKFENVFNQVATMVNAKIVETSAKIISDFTEAPTILYPNIYLESIFLNLLSNALKYNHPDRTLLIEVKTFYRKKNIILEVKDNGLGINLEKYGHQIFKLQKTFHRHPESRGIGLFMIKNQIEAMGGDISISSEENVGTTFSVNFNKHHPNE